MGSMDFGIDIEQAAESISVYVVATATDVERILRRIVDINRHGHSPEDILTMLTLPRESAWGQRHPEAYRMKEAT